MRKQIEFEQIVTTHNNQVFKDTDFFGCMFIVEHDNIVFENCSFDMIRTNKKNGIIIMGSFYNCEFNNINFIHGVKLVDSIFTNCEKISGYYKNCRFENDNKKLETFSTNCHLKNCEFDNINLLKILPSFGSGDIVLEYFENIKNLKIESKSRIYIERSNISGKIENIGGGSIDYIKNNIENAEITGIAKFIQNKITNSRIITDNYFYKNNVIENSELLITDRDNIVDDKIFHDNKLSNTETEII